MRSRPRTSILVGWTALGLAGWALSACGTGAAHGEAGGSLDGADRVTIGEVTWYTDLDAARRAARAERRPIWLHFGEHPG